MLLEWFEISHHVVKVYDVVAYILYPALFEVY